jgi:lipopolysaccharide/colanic/teichoic acid biosynthesis glycosyltransferase
VFFVQVRVGENGRRFPFYKLRSMRVGAERDFEEVAAVLNPLDGPAVKVPDDPRVTRVGRRLRRWSLDELPQLWNALRGDMSLVGPRPEQVSVVEHYTDWHRQRLAVKPGLTGPMQISGRGMLSLDERVRLELDYIEHYSIWRDVEILIKTIPAVVLGKGAF